MNITSLLKSLALSSTVPPHHPAPTSLPCPTKDSRGALLCLCRRLCSQRRLSLPCPFHLSHHFCRLSHHLCPLCLLKNPVCEWVCGSFKRWMCISRTYLIVIVGYMYITQVTEFSKCMYKATSPFSSSSSPHPRTVWGGAWRLICCKIEIDT